ncbi:MAG: hypothetical protein CSA20_01645 [Deltaproteobacteria bacterium]|nr:MAG: hypothetical protein CSA20_01645 [Deltaproteobacteria bacterium]
MNTSSPDLPVLKHCFPFRLAVPSYILPDAIIPNVRLLGAHFDEIALVLFESVYPDNLPSHDQVRTLASLAADLDVTYHVHLPIDVYLARAEEAQRRKDVATIFRFYEGTAGLDPTCYVMHLEPAPRDADTHPGAWLDQAEQSLQELVDLGMNPAHIAVENTLYPLGSMAPMVLSKGFTLCQDLGHLILQHHDINDHLAAHMPHTRMIHLHGIDQDRDHKHLGNLPLPLWQTITTGLADYTRGLCLEVFSLQDLLLSCPRIQELCREP